ncbi:MAG: hypothetical protein ABIQ18_25740 [Umezawaea sp.]
MSRRVAAVLLSVSVTAGCGITPTEPFLYGLPPVNPVRGVQVYFYLDDREFKVLRPGPEILGAAERLDLLFAGPTEAERAAGVVTSLPEGYRLAAAPAERARGEFVVEVDHEGGVDLDRFDQRAGRQIACTMAPGVYGFGGVFMAVLVRDPASGERGPFDCK